jgi:hypothetical protein
LKLSSKSNDYYSIVLGYYSIVLGCNSMSSSVESVTDWYTPSERCSVPLLYHEFLAAVMLVLDKLVLHFTTTLGSRREWELDQMRQLV